VLPMVSRIESALMGSPGAKAAAEIIAAVKQARPPLVRAWKHGTGGRSGLRRAA
jgi:hypothetical protein